MPVPFRRDSLNRLRPPSDGLRLSLSALSALSENFLFSRFLFFRDRLPPPSLSLCYLCPFKNKFFRQM
ncbi:MAG: hypothetical protein CVU78_08145 [Elusimicrobia bacterium HGW-Elusimicrobia-2]|nr:MAG: hypothetical protein CVU78_08145 [Elusimicrobia bacterium HGW-Elusimicrobia-2]